MGRNVFVVLADLVHGLMRKKKIDLRKEKRERESERKANPPTFFSRERETRVFREIFFVTNEKNFRKIEKKKKEEMNR